MTKAATICDTDFVAEQLEAESTHVVNCDEKTGIQAKEQVAPALPVRPGRPDGLEFEYEPQGPLCLIVNLVLATGRIENATIGPTPTEQDFEAHIARTIDSDPDAGWIFTLDQLNTHMSEAVVRLVGDRCSIDAVRGLEGNSGIFKTVSTRAAFLRGTEHRSRFI